MKKRLNQNRQGGRKPLPHLPLHPECLLIYTHPCTRVVCRFSQSYVLPTSSVHYVPQPERPIPSIVWMVKVSSFSAAAKSLQSCLTLCDPIDGISPGSPVPGILQARVRLVTTPWTAAYQAPPSMGFFQARILEWGAITFSVSAYNEAEI